MPFHDEDDAREVRVNGTGLLSAPDGRASAAGPLGSGLMRTYARTAGVIQWLNAAFFGWMTFIYLSHGRFYNPAVPIKGGYSQAYLDFGWLIFTPVFGLLSVSGFISGCGLVKLRPWVRWWARAYLGILLLGTAAAIVVEMPRLWLVPESHTALMLFSTAFALPCLPFLFGPIVELVAGHAPPRVAKEKSMVASYGVRDDLRDGRGIRADWIAPTSASKMPEDAHP